MLDPDKLIGEIGKLKVWPQLSQGEMYGMAYKGGAADMKSQILLLIESTIKSAGIQPKEVSK